MKSVAAAACAAVALVGMAAPVAAQVGNPATPTVGRPMTSPVGPPAPVRPVTAEPRTGPLPSTLTLAQALDEAAARSPAIVAAEAEVAAAEARIRQAGYRENPELSLEVENFAGTGELKGFRSTGDDAGRQPAPRSRRPAIGAGRRPLAPSSRSSSCGWPSPAPTCRSPCANSSRAPSRPARSSPRRPRMWSAPASWLASPASWSTPDATRRFGHFAPARRWRRPRPSGKRPRPRSWRPARRWRRCSASACRSAASPAPRSTSRPAGRTPKRAWKSGWPTPSASRRRPRFASSLPQRRLDPAVGVGVRHVRETGDVGLVAGVSMPLRLFDRNQGNIDAARQAAAAADARRASTLATTTARARNAIANVEAAQRRVEALEKAAVPEAAEALRLTQLSYREGRASLLELLDAQNAYTASRTALTDARLALALAVAELGRIAAQ